MAELHFCMFAQAPFSWHASKLPVIKENVLALPFWHVCVGGVRRNREFALCRNHSSKKWFLRWSCSLRDKQWGLSEISKGGNCYRYKISLKTKKSSYVRYLSNSLMWNPSSEPQLPSGGLSRLVHGSSETFGWRTARKPGTERSHVPNTDISSMMTPKSPGELDFFRNKILHKSHGFKQWVRSVSTSSDLVGSPSPKAKLPLQSPGWLLSLFCWLLLTQTRRSQTRCLLFKKHPTPNLTLPKSPLAQACVKQNPTTLP